MFDPKTNVSVTEDGNRLFARAKQENIETVWDRHQAQQPQCGFCDMGLSCRICIMGPCRVDPFGEGPQTGVCGADADIIVARNLCPHDCRRRGLPFRPRSGSGGSVVPGRQGRGARL